eukprot:g18333.t1
MEVAKDRMVERLVLEQTMEEEFIRCNLFFIGFLSFLMMIYSAYPADALLPVHETIANGYSLPDIGLSRDLLLAPLTRVWGRIL